MYVCMTLDDCKSNLHTTRADLNCFCKEYLNTPKSDNEEAKLTLLRQLKYLENCGADLHDTALESLLLDEIFNQ